MTNHMSWSPPMGRSILMVVRHLGDGHCWSLCPREGSGKIPPSRSELLHKMD